MRIEKLKLRNYKSFASTPELTFGSGFNVIAGQNSSGKTALLEVLSLNFSASPHRSLETLPKRDTLLDPVSSAEVSVTLELDEFLSILANPQGTDFYVPLPMYPSEFANRIGYGDNSAYSLKRLVENVLSQSTLTFTVRLSAGDTLGFWQLPLVPSFGLYEAQFQGNSVVFGLFQVDRERKVIPKSTGTQSSANNDFGVSVMRAVPSRVFRFTAERLNVGQCRFGASTTLAPNAANLGEVLVNLQQNHVLFKQFNNLVHQILPQVQQIAVRPISNDIVQIVVWPHDPQTAREDLAIPLDQCGTGIGQVLAILYVAVFAPFPQVILIDEPQSFLHPGAVRKLIEVLAGYPQHQFIITTHSPAVISSADPDNIIVTRLESGVSKVDQICARDNRALQLFLAEVGVRFSDVFGADNVLWVEGVTEEICFPHILREISNRPLAGVAIIGVRRTGDLETKDAGRIFEIYDGLSTSGTLVPPAVGFILDRECRSPQELEDIKKRSKKLATFLPRRMYENYLLDPGAINAVILNVDGFPKESISLNKMVAAIEAKRTERKYYCRADLSDRDLGNWLMNVDGAMVLRDLFSEFSEKTVRYDKVVHGVLLTRWLVEHSPGNLREVAGLLSTVLGQTT